MILPKAKHEHFAQLVANGETPPKAYVIVGYSEQGAAQSANRLLRDADVSRRIAELRSAVSERVIEKTAYGLAEAMREAEDARAFAMTLDNPNAVIAAIALKAKLNGLLIDRKEIRTGPLESTTDDELDSIIRRSATEAQISFGVAGEGAETKH